MILNTENKYLQAVVFYFKSVKCKLIRLFLDIKSYFAVIRNKHVQVNFGGLFCLTFSL